MVKINYKLVMMGVNIHTVFLHITSKQGQLGQIVEFIHKIYVQTRMTTFISSEALLPFVA